MSLQDKSAKKSIFKVFFPVLLLFSGLFSSITNAYVIEWLPGTDSTHDHIASHHDADGFSSYVSPAYNYSPDLNMFRMDNGSMTLTVTGGPEASYRSENLISQMLADFQIHKSNPSELPVTEAQLMVGANIHLTAFPAVEGSRDAVSAVAMASVRNTGLVVHQYDYLDGYIDDGLDISGFLFGSDKELLAVDTTYTFELVTFEIVSRIWDGHTARYGTSTFDSAWAQLSVPEPSSLPLMVLALAAVVLSGRRRICLKKTG
ncbi:PEP-CTERM sorting domain-containing protein [Psychromonas aquimarina]|uniref:PEP-CTERM sorting domain-containing protein n=1 Tax=Psychromonas aquimarina TaxID=444919 RepID=UPI000417D682|nr:PEP-CTERM sorting domain-containing protein [Psychromonas aquimarina]